MVVCGCHPNTRESEAGRLRSGRPARPALRLFLIKKSKEWMRWLMSGRLGQENSLVQGQPGLPNKSEASLGYMRLLVKQNKDGSGEGDTCKI